MATKKLLGVVHLAPLPSAMRYAGSVDAVIETALADAVRLRDGGVDGVMVENFGDAPFHRGDSNDRVRPDVPAALAIIARAIRLECGIPVGVNCLRNDVEAGLGAAVCAGATWVRANVLAGSFITDQGRIDGDAARVGEYRRLVGGENLTLLADFLVKHAVPAAPLPEVAPAARDLAERSGADALIVSGARTGSSVDAEFLDTVRSAVAPFPVWIGSGLTADNAATLWPRCDGAIVGTAFQIDGRVVERRVAAVRAAADTSQS